MERAYQQTRRGPPLPSVCGGQLAAGLAFALGALAGCGESPSAGEASSEPYSIEIVSGDAQFGAPGAELPEPLVVRILGRPGVNFLGGPKRPKPAAGRLVIFEIEDPRTKKAPEPGGPGESQPTPALPPYPSLFPEPFRREGSAAPIRSSGALRIEVAADFDGLARAWVRLGSRNGRWNVEARIAEKEKEKVRFTTITGAEVEPPILEGVVGSQVPVRLRLLRMSESREPGRLEPIADRQVLFRLVSSPETGIGTAAVRDKRNATDAEGLRTTDVTLGAEAGTYALLAEIDSAPGEEPMPAIVINLTAVDWVSTGLRLTTSLLLFVVGVRLLGNGFLLVASGSPRALAVPSSASPIRGYARGILAGATFQSASVVILHVLSFCNGGLLDATGALPILLGASLGGTLLPQLLSQGIEMLGVPFLALGVAFFLARKRFRLAPWGWVFLGAGIILCAWSFLDEAASELSASRKFTAAFARLGLDPSAGLQAFLPRFLSYLLLGAGLAFLFRTSNLLVVTAMALVARGVLSLDSAVPLVFGANLGASAVISIAMVGKRNEARRAAASHLLVQVLGCGAFLAISLPLPSGRSALLLAVEWLVPGRALSPLPENPAQHVATVHTLFNLLTGLAFAAFPKKLLRQVDRILPAPPSAEEIKPFRLDRNLLGVPALALRLATEETVYLLEVARRTVAEGFEAFRYGDLSLSEQVSRREEVIAAIHRELTRYLVDIAQNPLSEKDAEQAEILQTAGALGALVGKLGERFRELAARKSDEQIGATEEIDRDLGEVYDLVMAQFENVIALLRARDLSTEETTARVSERLARYSTRVAATWRQRIERAGPGTGPLDLHLQTTLYQEAFDALFRIASELAQIAERMRILRTGHP